jgi:hypothetical protein
VIFFLPSKNSRGDSNGFDVGDSSRTAEKTDISREWWLHSGLTLLTFDGFNQTGLFTTNISTSTTVNVNVKVISSSTGVLTNQTSLVSFINGDLKVVGFLIEFTTNINISWIEKGLV